MNYAIHIVTVMGILGIPSLFAMIAWSVKQITSIRKENRERERKQCKALQTLLRKDLVRDYKEAMDRGKITDEDLNLWESEYQVYHSMGKNGVMDSKRNQMLQLKIVDKY